MKKGNNPEKENRTVMRCYTGQEFRAKEEDGKKVIEGHPAVFGRMTQIGCWFNEIIERGAFDKTDMTDVALFINHNAQKIPLARSRRNNGNSTMTLKVDEKGLFMRAELDTENNEEASKLYSAISRGDMDGMSFSFRVKDEEWEDLDKDMSTRRIKAISKVFEVSVVTYPAYEDTDIFARSGGQSLESGEQALENARQKYSLESESRKKEDEKAAIECLRLKNRIMGGN